MYMAHTVVIDPLIRWVVAAAFRDSYPERLNVGDTHGMHFRFEFGYCVQWLSIRAETAQRIQQRRCHRSRCALKKRSTIEHSEMTLSIR